MTDDDHEAEIRRCREAQTTPLQHNPWGGDVYGWSVAEIDYLLRRLDEARAEITRLRNQLYDDNEAMRLIHEAAELLRAPVGADVREIAETLLPQAPFGLFKSGREEAVTIVARALQQYGDARARERAPPEATANS